MSAASRPSSPTPCGVPLQELHDALRAEGLAVAFEGDELVSLAGTTRTRVSVKTPPSGRHTQGPAARAIVRVEAEVGCESDEADAQPAEFVAALNQLAMLGSVTLDGSRLRISSRISIFEGEEHAWRKLHLPLLVASVRVASALEQLGNVDAEAAKRASPWNARDFQIVESNLSRLSVCFAGEHGFSAEFGLSDHAVSAIAGDHETALFQLEAKHPHPALGPGLAVQLHLPLHVGDEARVLAACEQLNRRDLETLELPPHFGAWCPSGHEGRVAYCAFLPPDLHRTAPNIAVNVAIWCLLRARWASGELEELADTP